jgi:hypothetical protein
MAKLAVIGFWTGMCAAVAWIFAPGLAGDVPAFRDGLHFYYPLLHWLAALSHSGNFFPGFNLLDGFGTSVIGETTSGLFYPLRILLLLPGLDAAQGLALMTATHVLIAAAGAYRGALRLGTSRPAACLAAVSLGLSCPVLFQHCNLVFLIGAAWTPWALAEIILVACAPVSLTMGANQIPPPQSAPLQAPPQQDSTQQDFPAADWRVFAAATSLMVLGGDPQAAAHALVWLVIAAGLGSLRARSARVAGRNCALIAATLLVIAGLTAVQWLPAWNWMRHSGRYAAGAATSPSSLFSNAAQPDHGPAKSSGTETAHASGVERLGTYAELLAEAPQRAPAELETVLRELPTPAAGSDHRVYDYSVAPWHFLTLIWPTLGGHFLPQSTRWWSSLQAEPRMWLPSLSSGLFPLLLALYAFCVRRPPAVSRMLRWVALFAVLAMLGHYGPVWLLRNSLQVVGGGSWAAWLPGDEVGSLYWLLTETIPGYRAFRYPAKWSVWLAASLALAAAVGLDQYAEREDATQLEGTARRASGSVGEGGLKWLIQNVSCRLCSPPVVLLTLAGLSLVLLALGCQLCVASETWPAAVLHARWLVHAPDDPWLGPLAVPAVARLLIFTSTLTLGLLLSGWLMVRCHNGNRLSSLVPSALDSSTTAASKQTLRAWRGQGLYGVCIGLTAVELLLCAGQWCVYDSAATMGGWGPEPAQVYKGSARQPGVELATPTGSHPAMPGEGLPQRIWASPAGAAFSRDVPQTQPDPAAQVAAKVAYQHAFRLGKLHMLYGENNLAAIQTAAPRSSSGSVRWLMRRDALRDHDPELEAALAWLGSSRRLVRREGSAPPLQWKPVPSPAPFMELIEQAFFATPVLRDSETVPPDSSRVLSQPETGASQAETSGESAHRTEVFAVVIKQDVLRVRVACGAPAVLVVRQYQDGGWHARLRPADSASADSASAGEPLRVEAYAGIFQAVRLPPGVWDLELRYRTPGVVVGGYLTAVTIVSIFGIGLVRWQRNRGQRSRGLAGRRG